MSERMLSCIALAGLRIALGTAFLSAVASRLGLWGKEGGDWARFVKYAAEVNWYLPAAMIPSVAVLSTVIETSFGVLLLFGWRVRWVAMGSAGLLMLFALAMFSGDPKSPFDYSVFTAAFGAMSLAVQAKD